MRKIESVDVNDSWMLFKKSMEEVIQEIIPIKKKFVRKQPWITKEVLKIRRAKIKAWKRFQTLRNENEIAAASNNETGKEIILQQLRDKYVKKRNETKKSIKRAIIDYEKKLTDNIKNDSKSFYAYVRSKQKRKDLVGPLKNELGEVVENDEEVAEMLNNYFCTVFTEEDIENIPEPVNMFKGKIDEKMTDVVTGP